MGKAQSSEEQGLWRQTAWVHIPALPLSCVTSGKSLNLSVLWFLHLYRGDDNTYSEDCKEYGLLSGRFWAQQYHYL